VPHLGSVEICLAGLTPGLDVVTSTLLVWFLSQLCLIIVDGPKENGIFSSKEVGT